MAGSFDGARARRSSTAASRRGASVPASSIALEAGVELAREPVERFAQRRAPALLGGSLRRHAAATVRAPALHPVGAAPRRGRHELHLVPGRVSCQKGGEVFDPNAAPPLEIL